MLRGEEKLAKLREAKFSGTLAFELRDGEIIEASRQPLSVPMADQVEGIMGLVSECCNGRVIISWQSGAARHAEVRGDPMQATIPDEIIRTHIRGLAEAGFWGQTTIERKQGVTVSVEDERTWKAERRGHELRALREKVA